MRHWCIVAALWAILAAPAGAQSWKLAWSDEFNGPQGSMPAARDWNFEGGWGAKDNQEIQWYCRPGDDDGPCDKAKPNAYEDGQGHLVLEARHVGERWSSVRLNTEGKHAMRYGRVEARLRIEPGAGFWPAFWLLGQDFHTVGWPMCGEQDIMEWVSSTGASTTSSTVHGPGYSGGHGIHKDDTFPGGGRVDDGVFHVYGMTWSENRMEFYRDDPAKPFLVVTPASLPPGAKWVFNEPFFVILNFAVAEGGFGGTVNASTPKTGKMWVDWVRWSQRK